MPRRLPHGSRLLALLALVALLFVAAGCGSSGSGGNATSAGLGPDPATVAPADAPAYFQAIVRPSGDMQAGVLAAARKVSRMQDPGAALRRALDRATRSDHVVFSRDIEPWLGPRIGGFLLMPSGGSRRPDWALAFAIADGGAFDAALARMRRASHEQMAGSYRGVSYARDTSDGTTYDARVGSFYVGGTLAGLRAAIDAQHGASLADAAGFKQAEARVPAGALAFAYADPRAIVGGLGDLRRKVPAAVRGKLAQLDRSGPVVVSLTATAEEIAIDASGDAHLGAALNGNPTASVAGLPGDAWLALATPPLGPALRRALDGAGVHATVAAQVRRRTGLDLDRDLLDPLGGLALFVRGESPLDMGGGVLLRMTSAAAADQLLTRLEAVVASGLHVAPRPLTAAAGTRGFDVPLPQVPQPIVVLARGEQLAAGYGDASAQDLLHPRQRLDASPAGKAAIATLGDGYTASSVLIVPPLAALLRSLDALQVTHLAAVQPYLDAYRSLAIGSRRDGDRFSLRIVAALR